MTAPPELTAANATHQLICQHVCRWTKTYAMPCHVLKAMPGDRVKVLVFGERHWRGREHIQRVRYVEAGRVRPMDALAQDWPNSVRVTCSWLGDLRVLGALTSAEVDGFKVEVRRLGGNSALL